MIAALLRSFETKTKSKRQSPAGLRDIPKLTRGDVEERGLQNAKKQTELNKTENFEGRRGEGSKRLSRRCLLLVRGRGSDSRGGLG